MTDFVVEFDCNEYVLRRGASREEVSYPDPLGCAVISVRPLSEVKIIGMPWLRDGEMRVERTHT